MMPKKAEPGADTAGLLAYLFGPGDRDEHTDPHLITAWDPALPCPARHPDRMTLSALALLLDAPVDALRGPRPAEHVWHASIRNAPTDRTLTDTEWAAVAAEMVAVAGIAPHDDEQACRWVAVRHAPDHIHLLATLARRDGRHPRIRGDIPRMHTAARAFETAWGLTPMSPLDETARRAPSTGEKEKATRRGLTEPARASLQRTVREAAALATDDFDFLTRLRDAGLRVREHHDHNGTVDGYAVALPGDRADHGTRPVWFSGRTLAYDLSLPRIRERYEPTITPADITRAHTRIREAAALLARAGRTEGAGDVAALGDLLTVTAAVSRPPSAPTYKPRPPGSSRPPAHPAPAPSTAPPAPASKPPPAPWNTHPEQPAAAAHPPSSTSSSPSSKPSKQRPPGTAPRTTAPRQQPPPRPPPCSAKPPLSPPPEPPPVRRRRVRRHRRRRRVLRRRAPYG
ncbi:hypothetical protein [Streptomyces sp. NPDC026589]|uniref:hypothetical protein n=1 Tax=Streptomyces sp. NPDC026589 TaxID=3155609 RepID=UPI0033E1144F